MTSPHNYLAVIKVVGIGGGGVNAVNRMIEQGLKGVEFIAINTDAQALLMSDADVKLDVGRDSTRGLGAGADPEVGRRATEDNRDDIDTMIREGYINAKAKGDCKALAERIGRPAWWVQKRASTLGLTRTNRTRLDAWTQPELDLLDAWSMCANKLIARKLREAGAAEVRVEIVVAADARVRSEEITAAESTWEQVLAFFRAKGGVPDEARLARLRAELGRCEQEVDRV